MLPSSKIMELHISNLDFDFLSMAITDKCSQTSLWLVVICHWQMFQFTRKLGNSIEKLLATM